MADLTRQIDRLVRRLPSGSAAPTTPSARQPPRELRRDDAGFIEAVERLVAMPLDQYAKHGAPLEIRVPWLSETLWFVPDERAVGALGREGVRRGRAHACDFAHLRRGRLT